MIIKIQSYFFLVVSFLFVPVYNFAAISRRVIATVGVGDTPAGIAITPDNRFAYVANNNNDGIPNGDSVSVIDLSTNKVIKTINDASFNQPYTITINTLGTRAYVTNSNGSTITIIDVPSNQVSGTISGFDGPSGMVIMPGGNIAYVNNYGGPILGSGNGKTVNIVDLNANSIIGSPITVGLAPAGLAISPDGAFVYSINYVDGNPNNGTLSIIQTTTNTVINTIHGFSGPFGIAITPNGEFAYVTNFGSNNFFPYGTTVSVVDLSKSVISATINVGIQPSGIAITPDGRFAYVTIYHTLYLGPGFTDLTAFQGKVKIIDIAKNQVICPAIIVGKSPANVAITSNTKIALVSNYSSNNVSVINISDKMWSNISK